MSHDAARPQETIRNKILYAILAFALFVIGMTFFLADLSVGDPSIIVTSRYAIVPSSQEGHRREPGTPRRIIEGYSATY